MSNLPTEKKFFKHDGNIAFIAGGIGGAVSRTVVSPFERVKILLQVQNCTEAYNSGIVRAIQQLYKEEGFRGLLRGNGLNCLRVFPYTAVQYSVYEFFTKHVFQHSMFPQGNNYTDLKRLTGGAFSGGLSVLATYPLDLIRTRLSIQTSSLAKLQKSKARDIRKPPGVVQLLMETYRDEGGIKGWYRGLYPTCLGVVPFVALNFTLYENFKALVPDDLDTAWPNALKLGIGAVSGGVAQTSIYPFDLLRRRYQVLAMGQSELGFRYKSVLHALVTIGKTEGFRGYYKGLTANLLKVVPSTAVQWCVYELITDIMKSY